jgi:hypothetical protein
VFFYGGGGCGSHGLVSGSGIRNWHDIVATEGDGDRG